MRPHLCATPAPARRPAPALLLLGLLLGCAEAPVADQRVLAAPGPHAVGSREFTFVDSGRPTPANGAYPGAPERRLPTRVWYPAQGPGGAPLPGPFPIIAYAHGFTASGASGQFFAEHLATHGYIVAAPDFPLSSMGAPGGPTLADVASQPGDLAFVLDAVARLDGPDAALGRAVDRSRQGLLGLSIGGGTVLVAAYHPALRIPAIGAAVIQAPLSCAFGPAFYSRSLPTLVMSGDADRLVPFGSGPARVYELAPPPVRLLRLRGGTHLGFVGLEDTSGGNIDDVGCQLLGGADLPGGFAEMLRRLGQGGPAGVVDAGACDARLCPERVPQSMTAERQLELSRAAGLAHFEAVLRGREDARLLLAKFAEGNQDAAVQSRE